MRQPDFFVVGAAKSGTTALWKYFQKHPEIFVTNTVEAKELGYYSSQYGIKSKKKYLSFFNEAKPNQLIGEVCHAYLTSEESAAWIKRDVPEAKIIIMLRNPVERAYSLYNWMVMNGYEGATSFKKALYKEKRIMNNSYDNSKLNHDFKQNYHYFHSGLYFKQVKNYFDVFERENVLVLEYNDFKKQQFKTLNSIFKFLNVKSDISIEILKTNKSKRLLSIPIQYNLRNSLKTNFVTKLRIKGFITKVLEFNIIYKKPKKINKLVKMDLDNLYSKDILLLSELCNIDFVNKWKL